MNIIEYTVYSIHINIKIASNHIKSKVFWIATTSCNFVNNSTSNTSKSWNPDWLLPSFANLPRRSKKLNTRTPFSSLFKVHDWPSPMVLVQAILGFGDGAELFHMFLPKTRVAKISTESQTTLAKMNKTSRLHGWNFPHVLKEPDKRVLLDGAASISPHPMCRWEMTALQPANVPKLLDEVLQMEEPCHNGGEWMGMLSILSYGVNGCTDMSKNLEVWVAVCSNSF